MVSPTLELGGLGALTARRFDLVVESGPDTGTTFGGLCPPVLLGTAEGVGVRLSDPSVSRIHAAIEPGPDGAILHDRSSTNGTFLGSARVLSVFLADGDRIRLGETVLVVRAEALPELLPMSSADRLGDLLGNAPCMRALFALLERLARTDTPVLVHGETGTGKELAARALHSEGARSEGPFVVFDCGAVSPSLVESELFGHVRGAFTGAESDRKGAFVEAQGGTLFLDEIGELPPDLQPKLLRALEARRVKAVGSNQEREVDVRIVAATHRSLVDMVNAGRFREDLYFRLAVFPVELPPLRARREDLGVLVGHFLERSLRGLGEGRIGAPSPATLRVLESLELRGNVRELRNLVERAVVLADVEDARRGELSDALRRSLGMGRREPSPTTLEDAKQAFERTFLLGLVRRHGKNRVAAAEEAGVHPKSLGRLLRRHGLTHADGSELD